MAWNLRWFFETEHDGDGEFAPQKIIERAHNLLQSGGPIGREAGRYLLDALATPAAHELLAREDATDEGSINPLPVVAEPGGIEWPEAPYNPRFDGSALSAEIGRA